MNLVKSTFSAYTKTGAFIHCRWCRDALGWPILENPIYDEKKHMWIYVLEYNKDDIMGAIKKRVAEELEKKYQRAEEEQAKVKSKRKKSRV